VVLANNRAPTRCSKRERVVLTPDGESPSASAALAGSTVTISRSPALTLERSWVESGEILMYGESRRDHPGVRTNVDLLRDFKRIVSQSPRKQFPDFTNSRSCHGDIRVGPVRHLLGLSGVCDK
jgi:hypothetical protein